MAVVATLANVMDADPGELEPLYSTIDPDALDTLLRVRPGVEGTRVAFTHEDHGITVSDSGVVTIFHEAGSAVNTGRMRTDDD